MAPTDRSEEEWAELIRDHGTPEEQLPRPGDDQIKVLSEYMLSFVEEHTEHEIQTVSFSYFGQIEEDYFAPRAVLDSFDKPQATVETIDGEEKAITHYTTAVA
jgi:hypothetical protein